MRRLLLVKYGEIYLKGLNRPYFMRALVARVKEAVKGMGGRVWLHDARIFVSDVEDMDECIRRVTKVFGVHSVCPAVEVEKDNFDEICRQADEMMKELDGTFKVDSRRSDKHYFLDSPQLNAKIGEYVLERNEDHLKVDVRKPQHILNVEIRDHAYLYAKIIPAVGGMPVGTGGKAALLLSGGIDSPVAGYMIAKRGLELVSVHFHSFPYTSEQAKQKVLDLADVLAKWCGKMTVTIVPFTHIQTEIRDKCREDYFTLIMRRFMMRLAEQVAIRQDCQCLITGESLAQVASQTIQAINTTNAVCDMPVLRPVIGMDKEEIVSIARRIETMDISILPYEDCCTVFTPKHPQTKPTMEKVLEEESKLDVEALIAEALEGVERVTLG